MTRLFWRVDTAACLGLLDPFSITELNNTFLRTNIIDKFNMFEVVVNPGTYVHNIKFRDNIR